MLARVGAVAALTVLVAVTILSGGVLAKAVDGVQRHSMDAGSWAKDERAASRLPDLHENATHVAVKGVGRDRIFASGYKIDIDGTPIFGNEPVNLACFHRSALEDNGIPLIGPFFLWEQRQTDLFCLLPHVQRRLDQFLCRVFPALSYGKPHIKHDIRGGSGSYVLYIDRDIQIRNCSTEIQTVAVRVDILYLNPGAIAGDQALSSYVGLAQSVLGGKARGGGGGASEYCGPSRPICGLLRRLRGQDLEAQIISSLLAVLVGISLAVGGFQISERRKLGVTLIATGIAMIVILGWEC